MKLTRPMFFAAIAAFFGIKASAQRHAANVEDNAILALSTDTRFHCGVCKKWWKQAYLASTSCTVAHAPGDCCHYGQTEVTAPDLCGKPAAQQQLSPRPKPANGECPVCGTKAEPYRKSGGNSVICIDMSAVKPEDQQKPCWQAILFRCAHCSAAFYQDAE